MPNTPPKESAVRSALAVITAAEALANGSTNLAADVDVIMREAKRLRPDQLDDITTYLAKRFPEDGAVEFVNGYGEPVADAPQA